MRRRTLFIALGAIAVVAAALFAGSAGAENPHNHRFTVVVHNDEGTIAPADFFDTLAPNSQAAVDTPVYIDGEPVGLAETILTVTRASDDPTLIIECSVELPDGNILFNGSLHLAEVGGGAHVPVVGGTGRYSGARGVVLMTITDPARPTLAFEFTTR